MLQPRPLPHAGRAAPRPLPGAGAPSALHQRGTRQPRPLPPRRSGAPSPAARPAPGAPPAAADALRRQRSAPTGRSGPAPLTPPAATAAAGRPPTLPGALPAATPGRSAANAGQRRGDPPLGRGPAPPAPPAPPASPPSPASRSGAGGGGRARLPGSTPDQDGAVPTGAILWRPDPGGRAARGGVAVWCLGISRVFLGNDSQSEPWRSPRRCRRLRGPRLPAVWSDLQL